MQKKNISLTALLLIILTFTCIPAYAEDITIPAPGGNFVIKDFSIEESYSSYAALKGSIVNNTDRSWRMVSLNIKAFDKNGQEVKLEGQENNFFGTGDIKTGETGQLLGNSIKDLRHIITRCEITFKTGIYLVNYNISMLKPAPNKKLSFADKFVGVNFTLTKNQLSFTLENKTENPIKLDWNQVGYVDTNKKSHKVFHSGVKYTDREGTLVPTTIPPMANIDDIICPTDYAHFVEGKNGGWQDDPLLPEDDAAMALKGKTITVFMPLEINGKVKNYSFTFKIDNVTF